MKVRRLIGPKAGCVYELKDQVGQCQIEQGVVEKVADAEVETTEQKPKVKSKGKTK